MPRLKINLPDQLNYTSKLKVRISDLNYGGHVGNDRLLVYMQEARMEYIQSLGFEDEIRIKPPVGIIMADCAIIYQSEILFGDSLSISIGCDHFTQYGFDMYYHITSIQDGRNIAKAKTGIVCFDYSKKRLAEIPSELKELTQS